MHLERDEFAVTYDSSQSTPDAFIQTINDAGYTAQIVARESSKKDQPLTAQIPRDVESLATALREAHEKRKPILLKFHAAWCTPCIRMENETFTDKQVAALMNQYVVLKVDTDKHVDLSRSFGVAGLPDIRLLSPDGQRQKQLPGFQAPDRLIPELEAFLVDSRR